MVVRRRPTSGWGLGSVHELLGCSPAMKLADHATRTHKSPYLGPLQLAGSQHLAQLTQHLHDGEGMPSLKTLRTKKAGNFLPQGSTSHWEAISCQTPLTAFSTQDRT